MDAKEFGDLCLGTSEMLTVLGKQALEAAWNGKLQFCPESAPETIEPLAQLIAAIAAASK